MANNDVAICVTGWHFPREFYAKMSDGRIGDIYVVSHKSREQTPPWVTEHVQLERVFFEPNIGYDWGCFQQFLEKGVWKEYQYVFFMHDDLGINDLGFVGASKEMIAQGHKVIGNGRNSQKRSWPLTHIQCYAHSSWIPPSMFFEHDTVRGSFFATSREVLERLGCFEVFWDRMHLSVRFGNWSLLSTCGKLTSMFGERTFAFLSEAYRASVYIAELERGVADEQDVDGQASHAPACARLVHRAGRVYAQARVEAQPGHRIGIIPSMAGVIVRWAAKR